ncbi:hypothetical protein [Chondrinema litorale]|uniref:hypothetical protein n=1 Tax=Chondrinema litorale TaxID=2994555 RepID=UPI002543D48B|nr:hypothetical protein [Chondrinema litorale]UZR98097.1 hypothetical protein OQ292_30185 [Chondrinema litorale]
MTEIEQYGQHFQQHQDYNSLSKVLDLIGKTPDTSYVKKILGQPIEMGFDYRYLLDSTGPNGCVVGAVFHIDDIGKIDQKWIGEICE